MLPKGSHLDRAKLRQIWESANRRKSLRRRKRKNRNRRPVVQYAGDVWNKSKRYGGDKTPPEWFCHSQSVNYNLLRRSPKDFSEKEKGLSLLARIKWTYHLISRLPIVSPADLDRSRKVTGYPVTSRQIIDDCMGPAGSIYSSDKHWRRRLACASEDLSTLLRTNFGTLVRRFNRPSPDDGSYLSDYSDNSSF